MFWTHTVKYRIGQFLLAATLLPTPLLADEFPTIKPVTELRNAKAADQDDMCLWTHPADASRSVIIASDKKANRLFVYNLKGETLQTLEVPKPGNIDLRQGVRLKQGPTDVVAVNLRKDRKIAVFKINAADGKLQRIDNGQINTGSNYGGTLYRSPKSGSLFFLCTSEVQEVEQYELQEDDQGKISGRLVRKLAVGKCEGAVGDDQHGKIYIAEENNGIWEFGGEPTDPTTGKLFVKLGEHGLHKDLEGITIFPTSKTDGYLIVSSQGRNLFYVFDRQAPHQYRGAFHVQGAEITDGIDVTAAPWGSSFPRGVFACHTDIQGRPVLLSSWENIEKSLQLRSARSTEFSRK